MKRTIDIDNLTSKSFIRFCSDEHTINFLDVATQIIVYLDGESRPYCEFDIEIELVNQNSATPTQFDYNIPNNAKSIKFELVTNMTTHDLNLIKSQVH